MEEKFILPVVIIVIVLLLWGGFQILRAYRSKNCKPIPIDEDLDFLEEKLKEEERPISKTHCEEIEAVTCEGVKTESVPKAKPEIVTALSGNALWQWWVAQTGNWNINPQMITFSAEKLTQEQKAELLQRYENDHPSLYQAIKTDKNWESRADVYAKVIGQRIAVLMR